MVLKTSILPLGPLLHFHKINAGTIPRTQRRLRASTGSTNQKEALSYVTPASCCLPWEKVLPVKFSFPQELLQQFFLQCLRFPKAHLKILFFQVQEKGPTSRNVKREGRGSTCLGMERDDPPRGSRRTGKPFLTPSFFPLKELCAQIICSVIL